MEVKLERWDYYHGAEAIVDSVMPREFHEVDDEFVTHWMEPFVAENRQLVPDERIDALKNIQPLPYEEVHRIYSYDPKVMELVNQLYNWKAQSLADLAPVRESLREVREDKNKENDWHWVFWYGMHILPTLLAPYMDRKPDAYKLLTMGVGVVVGVMNDFWTDTPYDPLAYILWRTRCEMILEIAGGQPHRPAHCSVCQERKAREEEALRNAPEEWKPLTDNYEALWLMQQLVENREEMEAFLKILPENRQRMLSLRLGFEDGKCLSLEELSAATGWSRVKLRTAEHTAARLLRKFRKEATGDT